PYRTGFDSAALELALAHLIDATPGYPLGDADLKRFIEEMRRELPQVEIRGVLGGRLVPPEPQPRSGSWPAVVDCAACFIAPKTSYFIASDLDTIGEAGIETAAATALGSLLHRKRASGEDLDG